MIVAPLDDGSDARAGPRVGCRKPTATLALAPIVAPAVGPHLADVLRRFLTYGVLGWVMEVAFTGTVSGLSEKDRALTSKTYLWMHPIYGAGGLALEWLYKRLHWLPQPVRALAYVPVMYGVEYASGFVLRKATGACPWDYKDCGVNVHGLIRLDYAPAWFAAGLLFEPAAQALGAGPPAPTLLSRLKALPARLSAK